MLKAQVSVRVFAAYHFRNVPFLTALCLNHSTKTDKNGTMLSFSLTHTDFLSKLKSKGCKASKLSTLYTMLPHHLVEDKLIDLTERTVSREHALYLACNEERLVFSSPEPKAHW